MKKITLLSKNRYFVKSKIAQRLFGLIISCCIILITSQLNAQNSKIYQLTDNDSETRSLLSKDSNIDVDKVFNLLQKLPPMIYIGENRVKMVTESNPLVLVLKDVQSFDFLHNNNTHYNEVELIIIHINQLSNLDKKMDFSKISGFNELKYIYIQCNNIECTQSHIKSIILNSDPEITILFQVITSA